MARIFIDGFNSGDASMWTVNSVTNFPANRAGFGPYCALSDSSGRYLQKNFGTKTELYGKCRWEPTTSYSGASYMSFQFLSGGSVIAGIFVTTLPYAPRFYTGTSEVASSNTLRATSSVQVVAGKVYLLEFYIKPKTDGTGRFILKLDGTTVIDWTGITSGGAENVDTFRIFPTTANWNMFYVSDVVLDDANWIGNTRVGYRQISGAGNYAQFDPLSGSNYQNVDEIPPVATDFNHTNVNDEIDSFAIGSLQVGTAGYSVNSIKAIAVNGLFRKQGSPTPTNIKPFVRSGSTDAAGSAVAAGVSSTPFQGIWETDPATAAAWDKTTNPEIGYKSAA